MASWWYFGQDTACARLLLNIAVSAQRLARLSNKKQSPARAGLCRFRISIFEIVRVACGLEDLTVAGLTQQ